MGVLCQYNTVGRVHVYEGGGEARDSCLKIWSIRSSTVDVMFLVLTCVNSSASARMVNKETRKR